MASGFCTIRAETAPLCSRSMHLTFGIKADHAHAAREAKGVHGHGRADGDRLVEADDHIDLRVLHKELHRADLCRRGVGVDVDRIDVLHTRVSRQRLAKAALALLPVAAAEIRSPAIPTVRLSQSVCRAARPAMRPASTLSVPMRTPTPSESTSLSMTAIFRPCSPRG